MESTQEPSRLQYVFGPYAFDPASGELDDGQKTAQLRPQVAKLLQLLLSHANSTVSRDDIRKHLWGDNIVVEFEEGISACVRQLRIALNDGAAGTRYIQTISRRGYKFVFPVTTREAVAFGERQTTAASNAAHANGSVHHHPVVGHHLPRHLARWVAAGVLLLVAGILWQYRNAPFLANQDVSSRAVIAVLPFTNLSQDPNNGMLGTSLAGEVITMLGPMSPRRMGVIASTSTAHYQKANETVRDIGQELGASYVLEGSVTEVARSVHISTRLIRTADQSYVWGDDYSLEPNYSGSAYRQLVIKIATQVAGLLAPPPAVRPLDFTRNRDAAIALQTGSHLLSQGDTAKAYSYCRNAVTLDPRFAAAYACAAHALLRGAEATPAQVQTAQELADKAVALDNDSAEAHLIKGELQMFFTWNPAAAGAEFRDSLRLDPGDARTWQMDAAYLAAIGHYAEMQDAMDTARALDPAAVNVSNNPALVSFIAGQYDKAEAGARVNASLNPQDELALHMLMLSLLDQGKYAEAARQALVEMQAKQASAADIAAVKNSDRASLVNYFKWYVKWLSAQPPRGYSAVFLADAYMHLGQSDQAFAVLDRTARQRSLSTLMPYISVWPSLRPLCGNSAFTVLTQHLGQNGCLPQS